MQRLAPILALGLLIGTFAGCLDSAQKLGLDHAAKPLTDLLAGPALWPDPQNAPHPAFGWATLSNPPAKASAWWAPIAASALPVKMSGLEHLGKTGSDVKAGAGIAIFGSLAVVPEDAKAAYVVDIRDPTSPKVLSKFETDGRGAAIIAYPNGRLVTVLAGTKTITVADITDPMHPELLDPITPKQGSHKLGVVPGTPFVYNAASEGGHSTTPLYGPGPSQVSPSMGKGFTEIFDLSDPANPKLVQEFPNGYSCHHIFFWNSAEKQRAICAGMEYTQLWDTKDPAKPTVIVSIPVHYGLANGPSTMASIEAFSHSAGLNAKGTVLYVGDENGGGSLPPGCVASVNTAVTTVGTPIGATWFYDVSNEKMPLLQGYFTPSRLDDPAERSCTTHHGRLIPEAGRDLLAMSYYNQGVIVIDFTNPKTPKQVTQWKDKSDTWETWYDQGYLFTGDMVRGMDVLKIK
jgi:hypothetical protein